MDLLGAGELPLPFCAAHFVHACNVATGGRETLVSTERCHKTAHARSYASRSWGRGGVYHVPVWQQERAKPRGEIEMPPEFGEGAEPCPRDNLCPRALESGQLLRAW